MGNRERARDYFRKRVRDERMRRGWSQSQMAKLLSDNGIGAHTTTIAKIEAGDRAVPIDEAAAIADLFEVSLDKLLGRDLGSERDEMYAFEALLDTARQASWQVSSIETSLRDRIAELDAFDLPEMMTVFRSDCERACDALAEAIDVLRTAGPSGGGDLQRLIRKQLLKELQKEEARGEAQS
ncbi:MAG: helix-turn-helix transcriptional regulator [Mycobacterium sp.]